MPIEPGDTVWVPATVTAVWPDGTVDTTEDTGYRPGDVYANPAQTEADLQAARALLDEAWNIIGNVDGGELSVSRRWRSSAEAWFKQRAALRDQVYTSGSGAGE
jgi:hypothetical protein